MKKLKEFFLNLLELNYIFFKKNLSNHKIWWITALLSAFGGFGLLLSFNLFSLNEIYGGGEILSVDGRIKLAGFIILTYAGILLIYCVKRARFFRNYFK